MPGPSLALLCTSLHLIFKAWSPTIRSSLTQWFHLPHQCLLTAVFSPSHQPLHTHTRPRAVFCCSVLVSGLSFISLVLKLLVTGTISGCFFFPLICHSDLVDCLYIYIKQTIMHLACTLLSGPTLNWRLQHTRSGHPSGSCRGHSLPLPLSPGCLPGDVMYCATAWATWVNKYTRARLTLIHFYQCWLTHRASNPLPFPSYEVKFTKNSAVTGKGELVLSDLCSSVSETPDLTWVLGSGMWTE